MNETFWHRLPKPFSVLAPMADVTDVPFRSIVAKCGRPDVFYSEFVSTHGLASSGKAILMRDLALSKQDHPIVAQFFGTWPEHFYSAGVLARDIGFDGADINMGCPDRAIIKQGAGAGMIRAPQLAKDCIAALREGFQGPISVKTRLGLSSVSEMDGWLSAVLDAHPDVLILHGRTVKEMSKVPAHWDAIARASIMAHEYSILCVGNGDVASANQGVELCAQYGVDGYMVGRGIFANPWLFSSRQMADVSPSERCSMLREHTNEWAKHWGNSKSFDLMRKFYKVYVSGWEGASSLRAKLMDTKTPEEVYAILDSTPLPCP